jgi:multiple sugar transport system ATP-binding protein
LEARVAEVVIERATKRFGQITAVNDLSLTVHGGEFVVLLGPTGAGKTTTLRLVAGLETPDHGRIQIAGEDVTSEPPAGRDVAFVFQQYSLYPHYTVFDNLAFPLRSPGRKWPEDRIRARVGEVAALLRIEAKLGNRATQLSGGEMQRVAIARALANRPRLLLADEPTGELDRATGEQIARLLDRVNTDGTALVLVTHDPTLADRARRVLTMRDGRIESETTR